MGEFIEELGPDRVTLFLNDWGGGQFLVSEGQDRRIDRLVLVACEAFDDFPSGRAKAMAQVSTGGPGGRTLLAGSAGHVTSAARYWSYGRPRTA
ncbi:hypothetical protein ACFY0N_36640 [Streptomyces vinaceus]|uniref:hypothetical protein n=1 Tax=Streptomyces vinaceus TaxID=1960 RepID=UPI0035D85D80